MMNVGSSNISSISMHKYNNNYAYLNLFDLFKHQAALHHVEVYQFDAQVTYFTCVYLCGGIYCI